MKLLIAGLLAASTLAIAVPASAQGIYLGGRGGGIGLGVGPGSYYGGGGYYRGGGYADDPVYEGRSIYRDRYDNDYDDDF